MSPSPSHSAPRAPHTALSAVLFSGGLDSAVLVASEMAAGRVVQPIQVRSGLAWDDGESRAIARVLAHPTFAHRARPLRVITADMRDIYPETHWAVTGRPPAYDTPDEDVYLEGRNIVLISKASVLCARLRIDRIALGTLNSNPFPDATADFLAAISRAMSLGLAHPIDVVTPLAQLHKDDVVQLGAKLGVPFALTMSCMNPAADRHCGECSKCRERRDAFLAAGIDDPTDYAVRRS